MAILIVGGSGKDIGKTALVCAVIVALRDLEWTAVKMIGRDYHPRNESLHSENSIEEECVAGDGTDPGHYLAAGARRALVVRRSGTAIPIEEIKRAVRNDQNVIFESNRIVDLVRPHVCLALLGDQSVARKPSFERLLAVADATVSTGSKPQPKSHIAHFNLQSLQTLSPELEQWLRARLSRRKG